MGKTIPHFLLLEPYYGGSHRSFIEGMCSHVPFEFTLISLPARKWKMRMQLAAPWFAEKIIEHVRSGARFDGILCSTFLDAALLRTMLCRENLHLPLLVYFHENQFAYPNQVTGPATYQFSALNFTTAVAADRIAFNSRYNHETFFNGVNAYLKKATDMNITYLNKALLSKSQVLYPGIDYGPAAFNTKKGHGAVPVIVWNHRWEHDKDPETFFKALYKLSDQGVVFRLIVLGQSFERQPEVFSQAGERLKKHILHFGYVEDRKEYIHLLQQGDIVVSMARHEFFGMAVLEAVRCGCYPVVPDRLAYCELFPRPYRYEEGGLLRYLHGLLGQFRPLTREESLGLSEKYAWNAMAGEYEKWMSSLV
jgi:glycosyltransferase involved in cell wall biosynthesis